MRKVEKDIRHLGVMQKRLVRITDELEMLREEAKPERFEYARTECSIHCSYMRGHLASKIFFVSAQVQELSTHIERLISKVQQEGGAE